MSQARRVLSGRASRLQVTAGWTFMYVMQSLFRRARCHMQPVSPAVLERVCAGRLARPRTVFGGHMYTCLSGNGCPNLRTDMP